MVAPDVQIEDGKGTILISSEEGETEGETAVQQQIYRERSLNPPYIFIVLVCFIVTTHSAGLGQHAHLNYDDIFCRDIYFSNINRSLQCQCFVTEQNCCGIKQIKQLRVLLPQSPTLTLFQNCIHENMLSFFPSSCSQQTMPSFYRTSVFGTAAGFKPTISTRITHFWSMLCTGKSVCLLKILC